MKRQLFLALITFVAIAGVNFDAIAQETKFDVVEGGKSLGEIILLKKVEGIKTTFSYNSKIDYNLQGMILKTEESLISTYKNDTLQVNTAKTKINGKPRFDVENKWDEKNKNILRTVNNKNYILASPVIKYSYVNLFFKMPNPNIKTILYEISGKTMTVTKNSDFVFTVTDYQNKKSTFYYNEKGDFIKGVITNSLGVFNVIPKK
ncbi:MAG: hypothetical protein IPO64_05760 [Bacteroidetes bacterium]|jgi:hypothetical protein|nr:hypothetical protein [Bacteroidota bacterium]MBK9634028.1 hypothetical protein [Bacteroidota bacterium]MBL0287989.1 hypothetical protein [Bacteroidota bacterium]MBP7257774.1 hypothetical protein [Chitinophagales bacterium]